MTIPAGTNPRRRARPALHVALALCAAGVVGLLAGNPAVAADGGDGLVTFEATPGRGEPSVRPKPTARVRSPKLLSDKSPRRRIIAQHSPATADENSDEAKNPAQADEAREAATPQEPDRSSRDSERPSEGETSSDASSVQQLPRDSGDPGEENRRRRSVLAAVLLLAAMLFVAIVVVGLIMLWGGRLRRLARTKPREVKPVDPLWYLRNAKQEPKSNDDGNEHAESGGHEAEQR